MTHIFSIKKKLDPLLVEWPSEIRFRPSENKDFSHAYEFITGINNFKGINNLISYYQSNKHE